MSGWKNETNSFQPLLILCMLLQILNALDREERMLFHDRIRYLDRRILPGVTKLTWTSDKHALEFYSKEARKYCNDVELIVKDYKV